MKKKIFGFSASFYFAVLVLLGTSNSIALAQVGCVTDPYLGAVSKWPNNLFQHYYYDASVNSSYYSGFDAGTTTWNSAPYRSPVFTRTSAPAYGMVRFTTAIICANPGAIGCTNVSPGANSWTTDFRSDVCWTSSTGIPGCYNQAHLMNHEFGHVMTLDHNYHYTGGVADSIVGDIRDSTDAIGHVRSIACGDSNALNNRYGHI